MMAVVMMESGVASKIKCRKYLGLKIGEHETSLPMTLISGYEDTKYRSQELKNQFWRHNHNHIKLWPRVKCLTKWMSFLFLFHNA